MSNDDQMLVPSLSRSMSPMSIAIQSADFNRSRDVSHQKHSVTSMRKQALLAHARSNSIDLNDHDFELILPKAVRKQSLLSRKSPSSTSPNKPTDHLMHKNHASPLSISFCASFYSPSSSSSAVKSEPFAEKPIEKELFKDEQHVQRRYVRQGNVFLCLEHVENHSPNMPKSFHSLSTSENVVAGRSRAGGDTNCDTDHSCCVSFWPPVSPTDITFHDVHSPQGILKKQYKKRFFEESGFDDTCALNSDRDTQEEVNDSC